MNSCLYCLSDILLLSVCVDGVVGSVELLFIVLLIVMW